MDNIVLNCARKHLRDVKNIRYVENRVVQKTYSFTYNEHFRDMLIRLLGITKVEQLEGMFDPVKFHLLKSSLGTLKKERNRAAHTHLYDATQTISAPSAIDSHFQNVYNGLKDVESCIRRLRV